jgi:hypothetical protein
MSLPREFSTRFGHDSPVPREANESHRIVPWPSLLTALAALVAEFAIHEFNVNVDVSAILAKLSKRLQKRPQRSDEATDRLCNKGSFVYIHR